MKLEGTASGLTLTDGTAITLSISNGMIIGTAGTDSVNSALSGKIAFAIAIDSASGEVYVAQYLALHQPTASNPNDVVTLAANSVGVTVTLTDGDGTQSSTSSDVSTHVQFYDDGRASPRFRPPMSEMSPIRPSTGRGSRPSALTGRV